MVDPAGIEQGFVAKLGRGVAAVTLDRFLLCSRAGQLPWLGKRKSMAPAFYFYSADT